MMASQTSLTRPHGKHRPPFLKAGFALVELLVALAIAALLLGALGTVLSESEAVRATASRQNELAREARFAMQRMTQAVSHSRRLLLPLADKASSNWPEHIREETVPPSAPIGSSTKATAVLAVTLPAYVDLDLDGVPDADDDGDGLIDEDLPNDNMHDFYPGIPFIDDDGDGAVDENPSGWWDDDEGSAFNEDAVDGQDNDNDNNIDEDSASDMNGDGCPGVCGVDDDGDGQIDEGSSDDDDEDGGGFDDPYDPVVFYLDTGTLMERMPARWNTDGISVPDGPVDGRDFISSAIAENVSRFRVERVPLDGDRAQLVDLKLELTRPDTGETVIVHTRVRVGGAL